MLRYGYIYRNMNKLTLSCTTMYKHRFTSLADDNDAVLRTPTPLFSLTEWFPTSTDPSRYERLICLRPLVITLIVNYTVNPHEYKRLHNSRSFCLNSQQHDCIVYTYVTSKTYTYIYFIRLLKTDRISKLNMAFCTRTS